MPFLIREIPYSNPCPEVFSPATVTALFRNSSQMLASDVLRIRPRYLVFASFPNDHSLCIQGLRRLNVGLTARRPGFNHRSVQVGFLVTKVILGLVPPPVLLYSLSVFSHQCNIVIFSLYIKLCYM